MIDRRSVLAGIALLPPMASAALAQGSSLRTAAIPGAGAVPVVGVGTANAAFNAPSPALKESLARFAALGGSVIDTAPSYGNAEETLGQLIAELGIRNRLFLATKVGVDSKAEGLAQIEQSFKRLRTDRIDLIAVHNLRDVDNQLAILRDLKARRRIRAYGITTSADRQYEEFEAVMRRQAMDTIQVDYALDNRNAAQRILPLAQDKGCAVFVNLPFGRSRLFDKTAGKPLPDWARDFGAASWAQFFLKYVLSHPARPIAIPGMSKVAHVADNVAAARGPLPDAKMRLRMEQLIDAL